MREIKFNAVDTDRNIVYRYDDWFEEEGTEEFHNENLAKFLEEHYGCKLMQYTGLKDKNGVEIYNSDLLKDDEDRIFKVIEDNRVGKTGYIMRCIRNKDKDHITLDGFNDFWSWLYPENNIEVIGNIYENEELLK